MAAIFIVALASRAAAEPDAARQSAATSGCPRDPRSVALLIADLTGDESSDIRATAAEALGCGGDLRAVEPITAAVAEKDPVIRLAAVDAIARFGEGGRFDGDLPLRLMADRRAAATPGLHDLLARIGAMNGVVDALGHVVTDTAASGQAQNAQADDWSRGDAAWALGRLGNQRAVYYLSLALSDSDDIVRAEAARALIRLGDSRGLPVLARHLADWFYGPRIALVLRREHWTPETDADRIHLWIARRDRARLVRYWSATKTVLLADLKSRFALSALYAAITIGEADFIPDATATLVTGGNRAMAEAFLNCGQPDLKDAAEAWAKARGYAILAGPDAPPVSWGEM
jgi:HEAT repeat protein